MQKLPGYIFLCLAGCAAGDVNAQSDSLVPANNPEVSSKISIQRLNINSRQSDFAPFRMGGMLYFVSERSNDMAVQYADASGKTEIADIYVAAAGAGGKFRKPTPLPKPVNSLYHEGPLCFDERSGEMYFTSNEKTSGVPKIFLTRREQAGWTAPELLALGEATATCCHPALSSGGDTLFYSSNAGGSPDMDLYMAVRRNGTWMNPQKAEGLINTGANELFPFLISDQLYFASNRPGGKGGLDIYVKSLSDANVPPELLPEPINSISDDFGVWIDSSMSGGYFSSNRNPVYSDDIFAFRTDIPDFSLAKTPGVKNTFCYSFYEETSMATSDTADFAYEWDFGDGTKARGLQTRHCFPRPGTYPVALNVVEKVSGEFLSSKVNYVLDVPEPEKLYIVASDSAEAGKSIIVSAKNSAVKGYELERIFWSFGDGWYNSGTTVSHSYRKAGEYPLELWVLARHRQTGRIEKFRISKTVTVSDKNN
jgi:hypothetical protein